MKKLNKSQLKKLRDYFAGQKDVELVYLYGSFVKGATHKRSDIDFGILFNPPIKSFYRLGEIIGDLADLGLPAQADVRDINLKASPVYLMNIIQGELIYARVEKKRTAFEVDILRRFYDTQRFRDIKYYYMSKRLKEGRYGY